MQAKFWEFNLKKTLFMSLSINLTSNSKYLMVSSWLQLISLLISYENLVLDQDNNLCLISLSILITSCWIIYGYIMRRSYALITSESERGLVSGCADLFKQLIYRKVVCPDSMLSICTPHAECQFYHHNVDNLQSVSVITWFWVEFGVNKHKQCFQWQQKCTNL